MARHARGAAGAWAPRRGNEEERLPLVSDADADARSAPHHPAGVRGDGAASLFSRGGARFAIRAAYAVALLATLSALAFAGWHRGAARVGAVDATGSPFPAVAHEIWLGDAMPEVKRLLFERNKALLEGLGWRVRLWGLDDVTRENFPATYDALRRGLDHEARTGDAVFSMVGDLMKFEILHAHAGLYLDTNVELLRDPSDLFLDALDANREAWFVADPGDNRFISAGMIGALRPDAALLAEVVRDPEYLASVDFAKHCIANAVTGPVMLTMHLERDPKLMETIHVFDRDVAYPLACGENYLDPCAVEVATARDGADDVPSRADDDAKPDDDVSRARAFAAAIARSVSGVGGAVASAASSLGGPNLEAVGPQRSVEPRRAGGGGRPGRVAGPDGSAGPDGLYAALGGGRRRLAAETGETSRSSSRLVRERDGSIWNVTVPCASVRARFPDSYAIDHFSVGGASWQRDCDRVEKARDMVEWVETRAPREADLVHKWAMSAVRYLAGPERARELVRRVRAHRTGGKAGSARVVVVASALRSGGALLNEMLETTADHPVDSKIWYREDEARADAFFATYVTLGDALSDGRGLEAPEPGSWQERLREYLAAAGVSEAAMDEARRDPARFLEETAARMWELGVDVVHVMLTQSGEGLRKRREGEEGGGEAEEEEEAEVEEAQVGAEAEAPETEAEAPETEAEAPETEANPVPSSGGDDPNALDAEETLRAILAAFPDSPTICLKRRNVLDAYASLYRAEHGETPWQLIAEPPPAPAERTPSSAEAGPGTGAWDLGAGAGGEGAGGGGEGEGEGAGEFTDGADGRASAEAFGAFGRSAASHRGSGVGVGSGTVVFDAEVFSWLRGFEEEWLPRVAEATERLGSRRCVELTYEDDLLDERKQARTLERLRRAFHLDLNLEALSLQKLRRISAGGVTRDDFANPEDLTPDALAYLSDEPPTSER